ncbi:MAG TPA: PHB depolymerase family esterase [Polyangiaceae bacterium]|nr:PHB depolymerase family esterase [Polyangiaceae bacterium]
MTISEWTFETKRIGSPSLVAFGVVGLLLTHCGGTSTNGTPRAPEAAPGGTPRCPATASAPPSVLDCSAVAGGAEPRVDDFNDGDMLLPSNEQRVGEWYRFTDETTGCATLGVEKGDASPALHFSGGGFRAWGAGFGTALAWSNAAGGLCAYDASAYSGVRFRAKGNANLRLNVASRASAFVSKGGTCADSEGCFDQHGRSINLAPDFQTFEVAFCSLTQVGFGVPLGKLDATQITNLNFLVRTKGNFDVWVDDLELIPWQSGQPRTCAALCPSDELPPGVRPRPTSTTLDERATGVRLSTFDQPTNDCGPITRRYLSYVPKQLAPKSDAPVVIVLHGLGADAETMRQYITLGRFEGLADRDGFVVVYGNAAPSAATVAERPNGGGFRKAPSTTAQVDDFAYLDMIIADLVTKGTLGGKNPVFLAGLSDGGGLAHMAALNAPTRFRGIAEIMPYPGPKVLLPPARAGFTLQRVLVAYSETDPGMEAGYPEQLATLGPAWAAALRLSADAQRSPRATALPNAVKEGAGYRGTAPNAKRTLDSRVEQLDFGSASTGPRVRVLRFDHAGHLWPVANPPDREQEITEFGFRNQDLDMSEVVWEFFRSSL